ncbi:MAG: hypothetical protein JJT82_07125 [Legionellaceae bacterium]|nr:hypothetical protein [Legionellaceae bacterium]
MPALKSLLSLTMPRTTEKKEKKVGFDPALDTFKYVKNVVGNGKKRVARKSPEHLAIENIGAAFTKYLTDVQALDSQHQTAHFPFIEMGVDRTPNLATLDRRIVMFFLLLKALFSTKPNRHQLPTEYQGYVLNFKTKGWPVSDDEHADPQHLEKWQAFINQAAIAFKDALPQADLSEWSGEVGRISQVSPVLSASAPVLSASAGKNQHDSNESAQNSHNMHSAPPSEPVASNEYNDCDEWQAPSKLIKLIAQLNHMHHYGCQLQSEAPEKSAAVQLLAKQLLKDLKQHYVLGLDSDSVAHAQFQAEFIKTLHSKDELMASHRQYWKVMVANIALALTVIGTLAVGLSLLVRGHGFFNQTKSQQMVADLHEEINKSILQS